MRDEDYDRWLHDNGARSRNGRTTRIFALRKIESMMPQLGMAQADLEAAWHADRLDALLGRLKEMQADFKRGGDDYRILMPASEKPGNRLAGWRSWLGQYGRFLAEVTSGQDDHARIDATLEQWLAHFRQSFPGFERFDLRHPGFDAGERGSGTGSKQAAMDMMQARLPGITDAAGAAETAVAVIRLSHLNRFTQNVFTDAIAAAPGPCGTAILDLLQAEGEPEDLEVAVEIVAPHAIRQATGKPDRDAARAGLQSLLMFAHPQRWIDINQGRRKSCLAALYVEDPPDPAAIAATAECDLRIAHDVMNGLRRRGLVPRDMIDVHGFLWAALHASRGAEQALDATPPSSDQDSPAMSTNLILHGPPGTGKTHETATEALRLCGEPIPDTREEVMAAYARLRAEKRIEFVTFHQSTSYEDFIEGRQPTTDGDSGSGFRLDPVPGIFRRVARRAETSRATAAPISVAGRAIWRFPLKRFGDTGLDFTEDALECGRVRAVSTRDMDWTDRRFDDEAEIMDEFRKAEPDLSPRSWQAIEAKAIRSWMKPGDVIIATVGSTAFRAVGLVTGDYRFDAGSGFEGASSLRDVDWRWQSDKPRPLSDISPFRVVGHMLHGITPSAEHEAALGALLAEPVAGAAPAHVLIIDEINRANISKVFGELITLIEPDKRLGQANALTVQLPYSREEFGVPSNLHILGTMNTADRSIALLDTALRRRFAFREMLPRPELLAEAAEATGLDLPRILTTLNERIEYLHDREHQVGHAYFIGCRDRAEVDDVMRHRVIPLLAEYFFEDWGKVAAVLGEDIRREAGGFLERRELKAPPGFGEDDGLPRIRWSLRTGPFGYDGLTGDPADAHGLPGGTADT
ncbi:AAA family ATPase [Marinibacterium sp. SX1]|uniref:AAA family ATPase n=1 Tax=Marinibacterium sp. SX1 TaxID=3388424 RepID=UPI003D17A57D